MDEVLMVLFESSCFFSGFVVWQYVTDPAKSRHKFQRIQNFAKSIHLPMPSRPPLSFDRGDRTRSKGPAF